MNATTIKTAKPARRVQVFIKAAECLKTLAHPLRLRIIQLLLHGKHTVGDLAADCEIADNVGSDQLRLLQRCGFLPVSAKAANSTMALVSLISNS